MKSKHYFKILLFLAAAFLILFLRRPEIITHPQFWAEDGRVWYANAQNTGPIITFLLTQDGYFQTLSRITAATSLLLPIGKAPLVFNLTALLIQLLPIFLLASGRLNSWIPSAKARLLLGFLFLALPNTAEVSGNLTNAQWYLALSACLVILADLPKEKFWQWFDGLVVLISGLSGPFSIFLFPVACLRWFKTRENWTLSLGIITAICGVIQAAGIFFLSSGSRAHDIPVVTARLFFAILNRQVFMGTVIGEKGYLWVLAHSTHYFWIFAFLACLSLILVGWAVFKGGTRLRLFLFFAFLIFCASLATPTVADKSIPAWKVLSLSVAGARYWLIPMVAFLACVVWNLRSKNPLAIRILAGVFLACMTIGVIVDWQYPKYIDYSYGEQIEAFKRLPAGSEAVIPINPPGWDMRLVR